jgi:hypothetical protein
MTDSHRSTLCTDWSKWQEYVDPHATMTFEEWSALSLDERMALLTEAFGESPYGEAHHD